MLQEVQSKNSHGVLFKGQGVVTALPESRDKCIPCELAECIYCLNNHCCGRSYPPRNADGYCKDFVSIND